MISTLLPLVACPQCGGALEERHEGELSCLACTTRYAVIEGMPRLIPMTKNGGRSKWDAQQERGRASYDNPAPEAEAYFDSVAREFGAFCGVGGVVLDVGCGIDGAPAYVSPSRVTYVGLDPLLPERAPPFPFVQGVAERLPFGDATFDWVLSATSFDHFPDPERALAEIRRVLVPEGRFGVWVGVVDPDYLRRMHAQQFRVPSPRDKENLAALVELVRARDVGRLAALVWRHGIANRVGEIRAILLRRFREQPLLDAFFAERAAYHHRFYRAEEIEELSARAGFEILRRRRVGDDAHGHSLFVVAARASA